MQILSPAQYHTLIANATVLKQNRKGVNVLLTPDDHIIKLFYYEWALSKRLLWPQARAFAHNAKKLHNQGINAPRVISLQKYPTNHCHVLIYQKIPGADVRNLLANNTPPDTHTLLSQVLNFLLLLHEKGIFFRAIHLGNLLYDASLGFSLVDISDVRYRKAPLSLRQRARNLAHLLTVSEDRPFFHTFGHHSFLSQYCKKAHLSRQQATRLMQQVAKRSQLPVQSLA